MPDPIVFDLEEALNHRLQQLDEDHVRARSPYKRRLIEKKMADARAELEKIKEQAKVVDLAFERWRRSLK